jgi:O-methyltransferase
MHNIFITNYFADWKQARPSASARLINRVLRKLGLTGQLMPPVSTGTTTSIEQRMNMYHLVSGVLAYGVPGDVVELGCHAGKSAVLFQTLIEHYDGTRTLHVFDSFEGLPGLNDKDGATPFYQGQMSTTEQALLSNVSRLKLKPPVVHKGWFNETLPTGLPATIAFAHLDGDLYDSIKVSLEYVYPRLSRGAVCLIDDYADPTVFDSVDLAPGVKQACDEFLLDKPEKIAVLYGGYDSRLGFGSHGYLRKQ